MIASMGLGIANADIVKAYSLDAMEYVQGGLKIAQTYFEGDFRDKDITPEDVKSWVDSADLTDEEKDALYDEQFLDDTLPYINRSQFAKAIFQAKNTNLRTYKYGKNHFMYNYALGYVNIAPIIHMRDDMNSDDYYDTYVHEGIIGHGSQVTFEYGMLIEPCAELSSYEYKEKTDLDSYLRPIKTVKKLMEVIGTEPIQRAVHAGDDTLLKTCLGEYLIPAEMDNMLACLRKSPAWVSYDECKQLCDRIDNFTRTIYERTHGTSMDDNPVFKMIDDDESSLERYYLNTAKKSESYYTGNITKTTSLKSGYADGSYSVRLNFKVERELNQEEREQLYRYGTYFYLLLPYSLYYAPSTVGLPLYIDFGSYEILMNYFDEGVRTLSSIGIDKFNIEVVKENSSVNSSKEFSTSEIAAAKSYLSNLDITYKEVGQIPLDPVPECMPGIDYKNISSQDNNPQTVSTPQIDTEMISALSDILHNGGNIELLPSEIDINTLQAFAEQEDIPFYEFDNSEKDFQEVGLVRISKDSVFYVAPSKNLSNQSKHR